MLSICQTYSNEMHLQILHLEFLSVIAAAAAFVILVRVGK